MSLNKALVLDYSIIETGVRRRNALFSDRAGVLIEHDFEFRKITLRASEQITIVDITKMVLIKPSKAINIKINGGDFLEIENLFIAYAAITEFLLFNPSTDDIPCVICNA